MARTATVNKETKVKKISKANFGETKKRAQDIQKRLTKFYQKHGTFPSHGFVIKDWGYAICAKAVLRHKRMVCKALGIEMPETDTKAKVKRQSAKAEA